MACVLPTRGGWLHPPTPRRRAAPQSESDPFYIAAGPPARLAVSVQPGHAMGGFPFSPQPQVQVQDAAGNMVIVPSITSVTVSLAAAPAHVHTTNGTAVAPALLGPSLTAQFVNGTATFVNLYILE